MNCERVTKGTPTTLPNKTHHHKTPGRSARDGADRAGPPSAQAPPLAVASRGALRRQPQDAACSVVGCGGVGCSGVLENVVREDVARADLLRDGKILILLR